MERQLWSYIADLVRRNPRQLSFDEYGIVAEEIVDRGQGVRVLVFGLGRDSPLWLRANPGGHTLFVEHSEAWAERAREAIEQEGLPAAFDIAMVAYQTHLKEWRRELDSDLSMGALAPHRGGFDVILVDAPPGRGKRAPGRLQSIYEASRLCAPQGVVFVHDLERTVESAAAEELLVKRAGFTGRRLTARLGEFRRG